MRIGVKIYRPSDIEGFEKILENCDFIETMAIEGIDYSSLKSFGIPVQVHCMHQRWGVNFANPEKAGKNRKALDFAIKTADLLESEFIVIHPGKLEDSSCSETQIVNFLSSYADERLLLENLPLIEKEKFRPATDFESMKRLLEKTGFGFCLDFSHSAETAMAKGLNILDFSKKFLKLKPKYFHISDSGIAENKGAESHLHLGEGSLPLMEFKKLIPKKSMVALETTLGLEKTMKDIEFLKD